MRTRRTSATCAQDFHKPRSSRSSTRIPRPTKWRMGSQRSSSRRCKWSCKNERISRIGFLWTVSLPLYFQHPFQLVFRKIRGNWSSKSKRLEPVDVEEDVKCLHVLLCRKEAKEDCELFIHFSYKFRFKSTLSELFSTSERKTENIKLLHSLIDSIFLMIWCYLDVLLKSFHCCIMSAATIVQGLYPKQKQLLFKSRFARSRPGLFKKCALRMRYTTFPLRKIRRFRRSTFYFLARFSLSDIEFQSFEL